MKSLILGLIALLSLGLAPATVAGQTQPDIVVVMVDDLGYIANDRILKRLPNIKSVFLDGGLRFTQFYNESPLCCPGRAAFLSGRHTRFHGVINNQSAAALDPTKTIAVALDAVGYWTVHVGKYMNLQESIDTMPEGWDREYMWAGDRWVVQGESRVQTYVDRDVVTFSVEAATQAPTDAPLFMWLNSFAPHDAWSGDAATWAAPVEDRYIGDPRCNNVAKYKPADYKYSLAPNGFPLGKICRSLLTVDDIIGALRAQFAAAGRDPVWVFMSDNGMAWGRKGWPLKDVPEADRTPLYMAGPGIAHGATSALLSNIDLPVTLAELAAAQMPWADGVSFTSALDGVGGGRDWALEEHFCYRNNCAMTLHWFSVRQPGWRLIGRLVNGSWAYRLHRLDTDPWEQTNVRSSYRDKFDELRNLFPWPLE